MNEMICRRNSYDAVTEDTSWRAGTPTAVQTYTRVISGYLFPHRRANLHSANTGRRRDRDKGEAAMGERAGERERRIRECRPLLANILGERDAIRYMPTVA
jgi:hypothetical protein